MNEDTKLDEAKYFLGRMKSVKPSYEEFVYNLSAFISAARSVMLYMHKETETNGNLSWYESKMLDSDILKFFRSTRNLNIHIVPCKLQKNVAIPVPTLYLDTSIASVSITSSGNVALTSSSSSSASSSSLSESDLQSGTIDTYTFDPSWYNRVDIDYRFTQSDKDLCIRICRDYDVITFCEVYITELESMVAEGIAKGYITQESN